MDHKIGSIHEFHRYKNIVIIFKWPLTSQNHLEQLSSSEICFIIYQHPKFLHSLRMNNELSKKFTLDSLLRPLAILPATCFGILLIHHLELFQVEPLGTLKFILSVLVVFAPFSFFQSFKLLRKGLRPTRYLRYTSKAHSPL